MNYKGLGTPIDAAKGKSLLISYVEKKDKENLDFVTKNSDKNNIEFLEQNIKTIMSKWFENPELFKTLNYLGEP